MQRNRTKRRNKKSTFLFIKKEKPATFRSARNYSSALSPYERLRKTNERRLGIWGVKTGRSRKKYQRDLCDVFFMQYRPRCSHNQEQKRKMEISDCIECPCLNHAKKKKQKNEYNERKKMKTKRQTTGLRDAEQ